MVKSGGAFWRICARTLHASLSLTRGNDLPHIAEAPPVWDVLGIGHLVARSMSPTRFLVEMNSQRERETLIRSLKEFFATQAQPAEARPCPHCGAAPVHFEARFWIEDTDSAFDVSVPVCRCRQ